MREISTRNLAILKQLAIIERNQNVFKQKLNALRRRMTMAKLYLDRREVCTKYKITEARASAIKKRYNKEYQQILDNLI